MKKFKIIGLIILLAIFIVSNIMINISLNINTDSGLNLLYNQARAGGNYGNDMYGWCEECLIAGTTTGVRMICFSQENSYCINTNCNYGMCD